MYAIHTEHNKLFFIPIYCICLFCSLPLDLQSHGIYILARNNVSEVLKPLLNF